MLCVIAQIALVNAQLVIKSPDNNISVSLSVNQQKEMTWSASFNNIQVIEPSGLGLVFNGENINTKVKMSSAKPTEVNNTYPTRGVHTTAINHYNEVLVPVKSSRGLAWKLQVRVFNDGLAFRYLLETKKGDTISADLSSFKIPAGHIVWFQSNIKYYEDMHKKALVDTLKPGVLAGPPVTVELKDGKGFLAFTESNLVHFPGSSLIVNSERTFVTNMEGKAAPGSTGSTPWRVVMIGKDLNTLVNSDIVGNVADPADPKLFPKDCNTEWIKPGRCVWSWLADKRGVNFQNMKDYSKIASELGFEYNLVDEGWSHWKEGDKGPWELISDLVKYSDSLGVKILVWKAYPDRKGIEGLHKPEARREFFRKCKEIGVVGMKIDFFDSERQEVTEFYNTALSEAAEYQLMIDFHGSNKPTGQPRTYPNEMTREGVRGLEKRGNWSQHNTILPFTRYLAGHADFTPLSFTRKLGEVTWAHHIATVVQFTSPLMVLGVDPWSLYNNPTREFVKSIPAVWDETLVLPQSKIGETSVIARRTGNTWFLSVLSSTAERQIELPLSFLGDTDYSSTLIQDAAGTQEAVTMSQPTVNKNTTLTVKLNAAGGFVAKFDKK